MRKFFTLYFSLILLCVLTLLKIPYIAESLKGTKVGEPALAVFLVFLIILNHFLTVFSPFNRYEKWAKNKWHFLEKECQALVVKYKSDGFEVRLNIMIPQLRIIHFCEPWFKWRNFEVRKPVIFGKTFKVAWSNGNFGVNKQLKLSVNQGICGLAFKYGNAVVCDEFVTSKNTYNLNRKQLLLTNSLKMVASFHIRDESNSPEQKSDNSLGVINLESSSVGSENLVKDAIKKDEMVGILAAFSLVCAKFI